MESKLSPRLQPLKAMAKLLHVEPDWLDAEAEAGRIPGIKTTSGWLFNAQAVERVLLKRAGGATDE